MPQRQRQEENSPRRDQQYRSETNTGPDNTGIPAAKDYFFRLKFEPLSEYLFDLPGDFDDARKNFWGNFINDPKMPEEKLEKIEQSLRFFFPDKLREKILERTHHSVKGINFKISSIEYGSLDLLVELGSIKSLVKAFDANLDVFISFLEFFSPVILLDSIIGVDNFNKSSNDLRCSTIVSTDLENDFEDSRGIMPSQKPAEAPNRLDKIQRFLMLSNYSLVIPVLLSLVILFLAFRDMNEARSTYLENYNGLLQQQKELLRMQDSVIKNQSQHLRILIDTLNRRQ